MGMERPVTNDGLKMIIRFDFFYSNMERFMDDGYNILQFSCSLRIFMDNWPQGSLLYICNSNKHNILE